MLQHQVLLQDGLSAVRSPEDTKVHAIPYKIQRRKRLDDFQRLVLALFGINTLVKTAVTSFQFCLLQTRCIAVCSRYDIFGVNDGTD